MPASPDFMTWVTDPARTNDELFTVEILLEGARGHQWPFAFVDNGFEAKVERARQRKLNPTYRPTMARP